MSHNCREYKIRPAEPSDAPELVELVKNGMPGYPFESVYREQSVKESIESPTSYRVIAERKGKVVGTAVLGETGEYQQEIKRVVVSPTERGNGLASTMTKHLADKATAAGIVPWLDARTREPAMQQAGLSAGMHAMSLEKGKHLVYNHLDSQGQEVGPARETMVNETLLTKDPQELTGGLKRWGHNLLKTLAANMEDSFSPPPKDVSIVNKEIPSAREVKEKIERGIRNLSPSTVQRTSNPDIVILSEHQTSMVVVTPDASAFVLTKPNVGLKKMVETGEKIGLQTITAYIDIGDIKSQRHLRDADMSPTMVRLNQNKRCEPITYQVGWRKTANSFNQCVDEIKVAPEAERQIRDIIKRIP
ncbi:MAG: GNAT family N-acetyltransferase [Microgenomates group bacterium]